MKKLKELFYKYEEIILYLIVGGLTTIVSLGSYYLLVYTILNPKVAVELQIANIISWILAVTFAYFANRRYVFKSQNEKTLKEAFSFYLTRVSTLLIDMAIMYIFVSVLGLNDKIIKLVVQVVVVILIMFLVNLLYLRKTNNFNKLFVFLY